MTTECKSSPRSLKTRLRKLVHVGVAGTLAMMLAGPVQAGTPYYAGTIKPSRPDADAKLTQFYRQWKGLYLTQGCGAGRYYVKIDADGNPDIGGGTAEGTITVSEAHGYGMLLMTLMADRDPDAQRIFDGMLLYFRDHPARSNPNLMAWNQVKGCTNAVAENDGNDSATDGDLDIAYSLLLADSLWGSSGKYNYAAEARKVLAAILDREVNGDVLLVGDFVKNGGSKYLGLSRSSDFMMSHFKAFAEATGDKRWLAIRDRAYATIARVSNRNTGLVPDAIVGMPNNPRPASPNFFEGEHDGDYSWNAARYPWRVGLDYLINGEPRAKTALTPLNAWARRATGGDPAKFADTYRLNGTVYPEHGTNSMAYVPMLGVSAMIDAPNQAWLDAIWDDTVAFPLSDETYFGNTLKLLGMIAMTGKWLTPTATAAAATQSEAPAAQSETPAPALTTQSETPEAASPAESGDAAATPKG